jgi:hydroxyethylthiazole kinase-like uncharacterized protein yjeF
VVLAGGGNNGGDGFVVARLLAHRGAAVHVVCLKDFEHYTGDARTNLEALVHAPIQRVHATDPKTLAETLEALPAATAIVDALVGTGARGKLSPIMEQAVRWANSRGGHLLAVDIPTGLNADTGLADGEVMRATSTVTMGLPKPGFFHAPGSHLVGELWVADLGFPPDLTFDPSLAMTLNLGHELAPLLTSRERESHKGDHGRLVVVGGSAGMTGAAMMAARTAVRAGAGLVKLLVPRSTWPTVAAAMPEVLTYPAPEDADGNLTADGLHTINEHLQGAHALLLGPGIGRAGTTGDLVRALAREVRIPMVIDADGLRALRPDITFGGRDVVLTPHMAEAAALLHSSVDEVGKNRFQTLTQLVESRQAHVILKGPHSLIGGPEAGPRINPSGNPSLATAGSGDVLAGILAGLLTGRQAQLRSGQGAPASLADTVSLAVYLHGMAADLAVAHHNTDRIGVTGLMDFVTPALAQLSHLDAGARLDSDRVRWIG